MRTLLLAAALSLAAALPARAQDARLRLGDAGARDQTLPRLAGLRLTDLPGPSGPVRPSFQDPVDEQGDDDEGTHDSLRNGTLTGLIIGGVIGALFAAECGHPECGPLISFGAGIGAAIGVAVDAIVMNRSLVPADPADPRRAPFDRGVVVGVKKRW
jgi:hypothetical protein